MTLIKASIVGTDEIRRRLKEMNPQQNTNILRRSLLEIAFAIQVVATKVMIVPGVGDRRDKSPLNRRLTNRTGTLKRDIRVDRRDLPGAIEVGTNEKYGAVHEFGGTFLVKAHTRRRRDFEGIRGVAQALRGPIQVKAHSATFPERPFMQPALERVRPKFVDVVVKHWKLEAGL